LFAVLLGVGAVVRFGGVLLKVSLQGLGQDTPGLAGAIWGLTPGSDTIALGQWTAITSVPPGRERPARNPT